MQKETIKKLIEKTSSDYSKIAADFDRTRSKYAWPIMQEFAKLVKTGDAVLDFGCGNGRLLEVLNYENLVYKGVDPVPELIDIARQKYQDVTAFDSLPAGRQESARGRAAKTTRNIEFRVLKFDADNFKLDFPDRYFDHIFAIAVFHHLPSNELRRTVLREFKRVLKDDGRIFLSVWNLWRGRALRGAIKFFLMKIFGKMDLDYGDLFIPYTTADKKITIQRYHHAFTKIELKRLARDAELKAEKIFYDKNKYNLCAILKKL